MSSFLLYAVLRALPLLSVRFTPELPDLFGVSALVFDIGLAFGLGLGRRFSDSFKFFFFNPSDSF